MWKCCLLLLIALVAAGRAVPAQSATESINTNEIVRNELLEPKKPVHERFPHAVLFGGTCGGSIISDTWILTAGHCTIFTSGRYVLAGTNNSADGSGVKIPVKRLVIHPRFSVGPYWVDAEQFGLKEVGARWDFLLAELLRPLPLNGVNISAVPLDDQPTLPTGLDTDYAGYGTDHHGGTMSHKMHARELELAGADKCANKLPEFDSLDMICTKGRPPNFDSACNGDSGSGLVGDGRLLGVASWVEDDAVTCRPGALVVFSKISAVRDWIRNVTGV